MKVIEYTLFYVKLAETYNTVEDIRMRMQKHPAIPKHSNRRAAKKLVLLLLCIGLLAVLMVLQLKEEDMELSGEYVSMKEIPEFMQFTHYSSEEWGKKLSGNSGKLTFQTVSKLLELLNIEEYITYEAGNPHAKVSRAEWFAIYDQMIGLLDISNKVKRQTLLVLDNTKDGLLMTQSGAYEGESGYIERYHGYDAYVMDDQLLGIAGEYEKELPVENVYVTAMSDEIEFLFEHAYYRVPIHAEGSLANTVCDVSFTAGSITRIEKKEDMINGRLIALGEDRIEIEGYGAIARAEKLPVYRTYDEPVEQELSDIVIGNTSLTYIVADKCVSAILLLEPPEIKEVRVLLLNEDQGIGREDVYLSSQGTYHISCGTQEKDCERLEVSRASDYLKDEKEAAVRIESTEDDGIYLCKENGESISLPYAGSLEIRLSKEGYVVVNAVPFEQYLYSVVPSEVPSTYPMEALKAQAVCARSYAWLQLLGGAYAQYGAHMDDSVNYQVYNKQQREETTTQAVDATCGVVLSKDGEVKEAYYYSTSYGHSGSYASWNTEDDGSHDYLGKIWLKDKQPKLDLSKEKVFRSYIKEPDAECYDSFAKYFRWTATVSLTDKSDAVKQVLAGRKAAQPDAVRIYKKKKSKEIASVSELGTLKRLAVKERNDCGGVQKLVLTFDNGRIELYDEYSMRAALGVLVEKLTCQDGSENDTVTVLPSSYFTIERGEQGIYTLYGGGYGHGIGMSQNGAKGMAEQGAAYDTILNTFYPGTELMKIY